MHVFEVSDYDGQLVETEEMKPRWFLKKEIPYSEMWPADRNWMPLFLKVRILAAMPFLMVKLKHLSSLVLA